MAARPVKVSFLADTADLRQNLKRAEESMDSAAAEARTAGQKIDTALDSTAESADGVASKGAQAAGALSGLGDLIGGKFGAAMMTGGVAMQAAADAGDLVNVVTESAIFRKIKDTAVTVAQTTATIAKTVADKAAAAASKAWAAAQWLLNAALSANPLGLLVIALAAAVAGIVIAYKKSETFRKIVNSAFEAIKRVVSTVLPTVKKIVTTVFNAIKTYFTVVFKVYKTIFTTAFKVISTVVKTAVNVVKKVITTVWNAIKSVTKATFAGVKTLIVSPLNSVVDFIRGVPGKITALGSKFLAAGKSIMNKIIEGIKSAAGFIGNIAGSIWNTVKDLINGAITQINSALEFRINLPLGKSVTINPPDIPHLAKGGIVLGPTLALIGEAGPEAVVPLSGNHGYGGNTYVIKVETGVGNPVEIGREVKRVITAYEQAGGR